MRFPLTLTLILLGSNVTEARVPRILKLRFPHIRVPAGTNPEACVLVRVPSSSPFDVASIEIRHHGERGAFANQHFLVYLYTGEYLDAFAKAEGEIVESRGCLDLGPPDRDRRQLIASGTLARSRASFLPGVALRLTPPGTPSGPPTGFGFILDAEWLNSGSRMRVASAVAVLRRARSGDVKRVALPFSDRSAEAGLFVLPHMLASTEALPGGQDAAWGPGRPGGPSGGVCVFMVTGAMHKRGRFIGVDLVGADGRVANPAGGVTNPFVPGRTHLFAGFDWTDEGMRTFPQPLPLGAGARLHYACWDDNGVARVQRLGCEESPDVPPGQVGAPAKLCAADADCQATDPAYPGRTFTGACRPANLVAGSTLEDEVCRLSGIYFAADPTTGCSVP
jgi:hypothetical protein